MKKLILILAIFLTGYTYTTGQGFWTQKQNFAGSQRCGDIGMATATKGYVFGGYLAGYDHFQDTWEYNPVTDSWLQKANFPGAKRRGIMGFVLNGKCYLGLGGFLNSPSNYTYFTDFYEYNPDSNVWHQRASFPGTPRISGFYFNSNNKGYVGGGLSGLPATVPLNDLWKYDPNTDTWTQKNNITCGARWGCSYFSIGYQAAGKTVYVGLGYNGSTFFHDLWEYNTSADTWTQRANFPGVSRWYAASFCIGNYGYMGSGNDGSQFLQDFYQYNPGTDTWTQIPNLTGAGRCESFSFFISDKGYVGTGLTSATTYTNDLWEYTPSWYGIDSKENQEALINIYPNPATNNLIIEIGNSDNCGYPVAIYDLCGQLIDQQILQSATNKIDISKLAKGVYFVKLIGGNRSEVKRFLKE